MSQIFTGMPVPRFFPCFRWIMIILFIVCNAVICSVSAWNMSLAHAVNRPSQVDGYLIFVSALSLLVVFPCMFIEVFSRGAISRPSREIAFVAFFCILECSAAVVVTATLRRSLCNVIVKNVFRQPCIATNVLLVFTWVCGASLIIYLTSLLLDIRHTRNEDIEAGHNEHRELFWCPAAEKKHPKLSHDYVTGVDEKDDNHAHPSKVSRIGPLCSEYEIEHLNVLNNSETYNVPRSSTLGPLPTTESIFKKYEFQSKPDMAYNSMPITFPPSAKQKEVARPSYESAATYSSGHAEGEGFASNRPSGSKEQISRSGTTGQPRVRPAGPRARTSSGAS